MREPRAVKLGDSKGMRKVKMNVQEVKECKMKKPRCSSIFTCCFVMWSKIGNRQDALDGVGLEEGENSRCKWTNMK